MSYSCEDCHRVVAADQAFIRSLSFRHVAWCQSCWRVRHGLPMPAAIPQQRRAPAVERAERRWLARRDLARR
jgi:hypothetical protein